MAHLLWSRLPVYRDAKQKKGAHLPVCPLVDFDHDVHEVRPTVEMRNK
ncbi:MAG: hypothetical protein HGB22_02080 [Chlorobiaceae bacterium]|nr:hypothetical protein [Chlorobiaceae bacterium]